MSEKKRILTGDRPTGKLHIGHYFGSLKTRVEMQNSGEYDPYILIADVQALTDNFNNPEKVHKNVRQVAMDYLACGIDPKKTTIYIQSMIPEVAELTVFYSNLVTIARLQRNPTVKTEIAQKKELFGESVTYGFLGYPVSQAADITTFNGELVPVGEDQKQHLELARDLAARFNNRYSPTFKIPDPYIPKEVGRVMSLQEPTKKMSKSDENENAFILLADDADTIRRKIKRSVTDSLGVISYNDEQPGIKNLLEIYSKLGNKSIEELVAMYEGKGYGIFKEDVAEVIVESLRPIREQYNDLLNNKDYLEKVYAIGAEKAERQARKTLRKVYKKVGLIERKFL